MADTDATVVLDPSVLQRLGARLRQARGGLRTRLQLLAAAEAILGDASVDLVILNDAAVWEALQPLDDLRDFAAATAARAGL